MRTVSYNLPPASSITLCTRAICSLSSICTIFLWNIFARAGFGLRISDWLRKCGSIDCGTCLSSVPSLSNSFSPFFVSAFFCHDQIEDGAYRDWQCTVRVRVRVIVFVWWVWCGLVCGYVWFCGLVFRIRGGGGGGRRLLCAFAFGVGVVG